MVQAFLEDDDTDVARTCTRTGLRLVAPPGVGLWRVARKEYGPLRPLIRTGDNVDDWCRFDRPQRGTMYAATTRVGAYAECLAPLRPALAAIPFHQFFDDIGEDDDPVAKEFEERGHMAPGRIPRQWRADRCIAQVQVKPAGWCVDVNDVRSLAVLRVQVGARLATLGCRDVDGSMIRSEDRRVTVPIARWIADQLLDDDAPAIGVRYRSRLSDDWECWAVWSDADGVVPGQEVWREPIELDDPDLGRLRALWRLCFF